MGNPQNAGVLVVLVGTWMLGIIFQVIFNQITKTFQWHHNECNDMSNNWCINCSLNRLFMHRSKKTSKRCVTGLCEGNRLVTSVFTSQSASYMENVSIWWRHHVFFWNMNFHMLSTKWWPFCLGLKVLRMCYYMSLTICIELYST